jgi:MFS family permease
MARTDRKRRIGALLSSLAYGLLYNWIGWRGLLMLGVLPALALVYIRTYVKEPEVWLENRRRQRAEGHEVKVPLFSIFKLAILGNTASACWWLASSFVVAYSITAMFATYLQKDLQLSPGLVALPVMLMSIGQFGSGAAWGWVADRLGRRWSIILPALIGVPLVPLYLFTHNYWMIVVFFRRISRENASDVMRGFVETIHLFKTRSDIVVPLLQRYLNIEDRKAAEDLHAYHVPVFRKVPSPSFPGMQRLRELLAQKYPAAASLKESEIADASFVDELARCGFIDHLYAA